LNSNDPNLIRVELVARALGDLCEELVLVGGCATGLLYTSVQAPPPRTTYDVDLVVKVAALTGYHAMEARFAERGFTRDMAPDAPICRWRVGEVEVDLMPTDARILGFSNRWYPVAIATARPLTLPSGTRIRLISAPAFLATKFEAYATRGNSDIMASHDFEDIINVLDGRPGIETEIADASSELIAYLAERFRDVLHHRDFDNTLPGLVVYDDLYDSRISAVRYRIIAIAKLLQPDTA
jgi:predicted nucleotidyltransferase